MELRVTGSVYNVLYPFAWHCTVVDVRCQPETDADKSEYVGGSVGDEQAVSFVVVAVYIGGEFNGRVVHVTI